MFPYEQDGFFRKANEIICLVKQESIPYLQGK
jgi:hypothetical protein